MIVVVCDNGGFGVINRLQTGMGVPGFNNSAERQPGSEQEQPAARRLCQTRGIHGRLVAPL